MNERNFVTPYSEDEGRLARAVRDFNGTSKKQLTSCIKGATMREEVKVVSINGFYRARYIVDGAIKSEYTCKNKKEIGLMCREMLRWQHKLGNVTPLTTSARKRVNEKSESVLGSSVRKAF